MIQFKRLDDLKAKVDALRPLPEHTVKSLHEALVLEWTYHSNAIEGNTLTLMETKVVLDGITIGGKSMREHFEAINHREAIFYVEALVKNEEPLGEPQIKALHQLVLKNIDEQNAGRYRQQNVVISGASHTPVDHLCRYRITQPIEEKMMTKPHTGCTSHGNPPTHILSTTSIPSSPNPTLSVSAVQRLSINLLSFISPSMPSFNIGHAS